LSWHVITVPEEGAGDAFSEFENAFSDLFYTAHRPRNAVLYEARAKAGQYYLSPRASALARRLIDERSGKKCSRPLAGDVDRVIGDVDASIDLLRREANG
jgi:hypothetical protein